MSGPRVTFTDWRGSALVYLVVWLTPAYLASALTHSWRPFMLAPFIYFAMMAQHKLHRAVRLTTLAKYVEIDAHAELRAFKVLTALAAVCLGLAYLAGAGAAAAGVAGLTFLAVMLYSGPLHTEPWIGACHYLGTIACFMTVRFPTLPEAVLCAGFSCLVWMLHKGLRIVTGDYGDVPVPFRHLAEVFAAWGLGVALLVVGLGLLR